MAHSVFSPQVPGQGSTHLLRIQALSCGQSMLKTHSGLHPLYASPLYSGKQLHAPLLQIAFGPHGDGLHGSGSGGAAKNFSFKNLLC